ncbi:hypothetical protein ATER59S_02378 [Aquamicrobium terrae]
MSMATAPRDDDPAMPEAQAAYWKGAYERMAARNMRAVEISSIEVLALKKLALICGALASSLNDQTAAGEQRALTKVLVDVVNRADVANLSPDPR